MRTSKNPCRIYEIETRIECRVDRGSATFWIVTSLSRNVGKWNEVLNTSDTEGNSELADHAPGSLEDRIGNTETI